MLVATILGVVFIPLLYLMVQSMAERGGGRKEKEALPARESTAS
jgi:hypothetical protein